jgi:hypothetical protein
LLLLRGEAFECARDSLKEVVLAPLFDELRSSHYFSGISGVHVRSLLDLIQRFDFLFEDEPRWVNRLGHFSFSGLRLVVFLMVWLRHGVMDFAATPAWLGAVADFSEAALDE